MQPAIRELQETAIVMADIQARQAAVLKDQAVWLEGHEKRLHDHEDRIRRHDEILQRVELNLAEATDKLNALINIVDDRRRSS